MNAVYIKEFGDASKIIVGQLDKPSVKAGEVLIKTLATTINNVDIMIRKGLYPIDAPMPFLLGRDVVGIVIDANNSAFNKGDIVWSNSLGYENRNGASASYLA
ncbi:MAG TPA: alcohol dehydrogenase catalytic domain-containing protein, partial [Bacilli bacterium]|nr:alcohol dehydrogenase catalytic domain-containing protein [Bacilli bacterium]